LLIASRLALTAAVDVFYWHWYCWTARGSARAPAPLRRYVSETHEITPMPDNIRSPKRIAAESFTDAAAAVARLAEIYERNVSFLRTAFEAYVRGEPLDARVRAAYPFVRITTDTHARLDSRLSYGFVSGPGIYETSVTRPDLFRRYFTEQIGLLM
jgi:hypothetical protein